MPRLINRTSRVQQRAPVEDERNVEPGTLVQFLNAANPECPLHGYVVGQYWDEAANAYLCIVGPDVLFTHATLGDLPRVVIHPAQLTVNCFTYSQTTEEAPVCSDCGQPSHGEGIQRAADTPLRAFCDECAIDLDVEIQPWSFVVDAQVEAENETADYVGGRRARQNRERTQNIRQHTVTWRDAEGVLAHPQGLADTQPQEWHEDTEEDAEEVDEMTPESLQAAGLCGDQSSHGYCTCFQGHPGYHSLGITGPQWEDDGTDVTPETWRPLGTTTQATLTTSDGNIVAMNGGIVYYRPIPNYRPSQASPTYDQAPQDHA